MRKLLLTLALSILSTGAWAQCNGVFPNNTACGNISGASSTARPIPLSQFPANAPGGSIGQVQTNGGSNTFTGITNTQLTALLNLATSTLKGALPAWPGNTTTFFRGDGNYASLTSISVNSIDGTAGAFITNNGLTSTLTSIQLSAARRTLPTVQRFLTGSGTYTTPANTLWIRIRMVGGGAGGGGSGTSGVGAAGNGGNTCWNTSGSACTSPVLQAGGGTAGSGASSSSNAGGAGGTISGSGSCNLVAIAGGSGQSVSAATATTVIGGMGGASTLGGQGASVIGAGGSPVVNSGSGGAGGAIGTGNASGSGGGAGATCETIITSPAASYTYAVGAAGSAGTAGVAGNNGGSGSLGLILVEEHYGS